MFSVEEENKTTMAPNHCEVSLLGWADDSKPTQFLINEQFQEKQRAKGLVISLESHSPPQVRNLGQLRPSRALKPSETPLAFEQLTSRLDGGLRLWSLQSSLDQNTRALFSLLFPNI